jgi:hypothetical protein
VAGPSVAGGEGGSSNSGEGRNSGGYSRIQAQAVALVVAEVFPGFIRLGIAIVVPQLVCVADEPFRSCRINPTEITVVVILREAVLAAHVFFAGED